MKRIISLLTLATVFLAACNSGSSQYKKGLDNLEYKLFQTGSGRTIQYGEFMQMHFATLYSENNKDSVLNDSRTMGMPMIEILDSVNTPKAYFEILKQMRKGDSVVIRILTDSAFKSAPDQMPSFIKRGQYLLTTVKILNIFSTREQADSARNAEALLAQSRDSINAIAQTAKDEKELEAYFAQKGIKPLKGTAGTYVEITRPGTGPMIDTSVVVMTNYTGRTLNGTKPFDSNTDPAFNHVEPLRVNMTNNPALGNPVIKGWTDGMKLLNKGAAARFYIPSALAYGSRGAGSDIGPNSILVFDIDVVDVLTKEQAQAEYEQRMKQVQEMQQKLQDSLKNAKGTTEAK